jgi:hypothetical protein
MAFPSFLLKQSKKIALAATYIQGFPRTGEKLPDPAHPVPGEKHAESLKSGAEFPWILPIIILRVKLERLFPVGAGA